MSVPEPICRRWQDLRWDDRAMQQRLVYSCECAGDGCPHDPRRVTAGHADNATSEEQQ